MATGPAAAISAVPAAPPRVGLITSARTNTDLRLPDRWTAGFSYEPENYCGGNGVADPCSNTATFEADNRDIVTVDPVVLWAADACNTYATRDRAALAKRRLVACQSKQLAGELWEGTVSQASANVGNRFLASPLANTVSLQALAVSDGLACLEEALAACSCSRSMIHVTNGLMTYLARERLVTRVGDVFITANDTLVVADAGYTGTGPEGQPAVSGSVWAYGTDIVNVALADIEVTPREDIEAMTQTGAHLYDNTLTYRASRLAAAWWDGCCHLAIPFDIDVCSDLAAS